MFARNLKKAIRKPYDKVDCVACSHSNPIEDVYRLKRDENDNSVYIKVGEKNINSYINSFKNTSSLESVLSRIALMPITEKITYINQVDSGISADISNMPTDATAAAIFLNKYADVLPTISKQLKSGVSINDVITGLFKSNNTTKTKTKNETVKENTENVEA